MPRKKISTTVYVEPEQDIALKALRDRTGIPMAVLIRDAIDGLLRRWANDHAVLDQAEEMVADHRVRHDLPPQVDVVVTELEILANHTRQVEMERDQCRHLVEHFRGQLREVQNRLSDLLSASPSFYLADDVDSEEPSDAP